MYSRPNIYVAQWCIAGNSNAPSLEKIRNGWSGTEKPLVEHMNWILNRIDGSIGYLLQGSVEWGEEVDYPAGKLVSFEGNLYRSLQTNTNKPVSNKTYWEPAFYSTANGLSLAEEVRKIKEEDGYLNKYLKISDPVTTARIKAGSYQADIGLASSTLFNVGYSFKGYNTTGMYLNGTAIAFTVGGDIKLSIPAAAPTLTDKSTTAATTDWVQRLLDERIGSIDMTANRLPIGSIFITVNELNPSATLGYGTWVRFAEGQVIVGKSTKEADADWKKAVYNTFGSDTHALTKNEAPPHQHGIGFNYEKEAGAGFGYGFQNVTTGREYLDAIGAWSTAEGLTESVGGGAAHNNVQPSIVANIWRRTA